MKIYTIFIVLLFWGRLSAQDQLGIRLDNYTGMDQAWLNPAFSASSPTVFDFHLIGAGAFAENNYAFVPNTSLLDFNPKTTLIHIDSIKGGLIPKDAKVIDLSTKKGKKYAQFTSLIAGPSFQFKIKQHCFGVFSNIRMNASVNKIPTNLGFYTYKEIPYNQKFNVTAFKGAGAIWSETGFHYSYNSLGFGQDFSFGINLKYNVFSESVFLDLKKDFNYTKDNVDSATINHPIFEFGFTPRNIDQFNRKGQSELNPKINIYGKSISTDIGFTYQVYADKSNQYLYRIGFSILDIGIVSIKNSRVNHSQNTSREIILEYDQIKNANTIQGLERKISAVSYGGDSTALLKSSHFKLGLPTALSIQGDYQFLPNIFIGGAIIQPIALTAQSLKRPAILAISPRYEKRFLSLSMPLVLRNWNSLRMGLAARLGYISFGTDNLQGLAMRKNFTGADFYVSIRFNFVKWRKKGQRKHGKLKLKCYHF